MGVIQQTLAERKWADDLSRRNKVYKYIEYYENYEEDYVTDYISNMYPKSYNKLIKYFGRYPLTTLLIDDLSIAFNDIDIEITNNEKLSDTFNDVLSNMDFISALQSMDKMVNLTKKVGIMPIYRNNKIILDVVTADKCFVEQKSNDANDIDALYIEIPNAVNSPTKTESVQNYIRWTAEDYTFVEIDHVDGHIIESSEPYLHGYGQIPIVWFDNFYDSNKFWSDMNSAIIDAHTEIDIDITNLNYTMAYQSFSTLVTTGLNKELNINFGPSNYLNLPADVVGGNNPDAKYLTPQPSLNTMWKIINEKIINIANSVLGHASGYKTSGTQYNSGYQMLIAKSKLFSKNVQHQNGYKDSLIKLLKMIMTSYNLYIRETFDVKSADIDITFAKFETIYSRKEELEIEKLEIEIEKMKNYAIGNDLENEINNLV